MEEDSVSIPSSNLPTLFEKPYTCPVCKKHKVVIPFMICQTCLKYEKNQICRNCNQTAYSHNKADGRSKANLNKELLCYRCASVPRCFVCGYTTKEGELSCKKCGEDLEEQFDYVG